GTAALRQEQSFAAEKIVGRALTRRQRAPSLTTGFPTNQRRHVAEASFIAPGKPFRLIYRSDQSADGADHRENASDIALIESMDGNASADQLCRDLRLEIGEGEDEVRLERAD